MGLIKDRAAAFYSEQIECHMNILTEQFKICQILSTSGIVYRIVKGSVIDRYESSWWEFTDCHLVFELRSEDIYKAESILNKKLQYRVQEARANEVFLKTGDDVLVGLSSV